MKTRPLSSNGTRRLVFTWAYATTTISILVMQQGNSFYIQRYRNKIHRWISSRTFTDEARKKKSSCHRNPLIQSIDDLVRKQPTDSAHVDMTTTTTTSKYWQRLGKPTTVLAPMVAQSDLAFRLLCRKYGTELCYTQMNHARNFVRSKLFQDTQLDVSKEGIEGIQMNESGWNALRDTDWQRFRKCSTEQETHRLKGLYEQSHRIQSSINDLDGSARNQNNIPTRPSDTRWSVYKENLYSNNNHSPLIVQLAGHDPSIMSLASQIILQRTNTNRNAISERAYSGSVSGIDVNCGCPQAIARSGRYGAFLMEESFQTVCDVLSRLRKDLPESVGVSVKIRIPEGGSKTKDGRRILKERLIRMIDAGVELVTVHGRTLKENKTKTKECDWDAIAWAVESARDYSGVRDFPIIANGGIEFPSDVRKCLDYTKASAVMSSEGILENPGIFHPGATDDTEMNPQEIFHRQLRYSYEYLDICMLYPPLSYSLGKMGGSFNCIRGHIFKFLYRYLEDNPDLRDRLGHPHLTSSITDARNIVSELEGRYSHLFSENQFNAFSSQDVLRSSWYRRHRDAAQRVHTRGEYSKVDSKLPIEDKKKMILKRINILKENRRVKEEKTSNAT